MEAFECNIDIPSRHVPWGGATGDGDWRLFGFDWSAASFKLTAVEAFGGTAIIALNTAVAGSEGISASYDANLTTRDGRQIGGTVIRAQIDEATLESSSTWGSTPTSSDKVLHYDLVITPSGDVQRVFCFGTITIKPGVSD